MGNLWVPRFDSSSSSSSSTRSSSPATDHNHSSSAFERRLARGQTLKMTLLPPGFQFRLSHLELLRNYLLMKVLGEHPSDAIIEGEVYGDDALLPEADDIDNRELYMLVKIKKNKNGTKTERMTKNGHWRLTGNKKTIEDESGIHIGTMRSLVLVVDRNKSGRKRKLLMDEYTLDGSLKTINSEGWALCKIYGSKRSPERPNSQEEEGDGLTSRPTAWAMMDPPTLIRIDYNWDNHDGLANMNNEDVFNECLDYTYYPEGQSGPEGQSLCGLVKEVCKALMDVDINLILCCRRKPNQQ